ncbi:MULTISPECIES: efflux RND transporter periplasmic adaptor subunit [unclassified Rhizobium]|uniref:efflux RND transporter periplasmic adaptor subunit n=1 Tax=unclassified Rhizobium TaxID=2613769 RepID=UPI000715DF51|nr:MULTISPECIES: efflux RND transporter periplasmic adaptor subunit [unclassified Rhizobium]KQS89535.1 RND transporter MFP subunit [Rhizobium sp. Leaf391]KQS94814.1 RND transporter MFP subunit [Rhizobium sp. Leaf386]KQU01191.1 RND transporter MFP subunit [Rhizobium sp. Leaf453]
MSFGTFKTKLLTTGLVLAVATIAPTIYFDVEGGTTGAGNAADATTAAAPVAVPVSVAVVEAKPVTQWSEFSGRLEAVDRVEVRSRAAGAIQSVHFQEGAIVEKGDLLVTIDQAPYQAEVARAQANVTAAQARVSLASIELKRGQQLLATNAVSQSEVDQRMNAEASAKADLEAARAVLQTAALNLGYTEIRAPITGRVGKIEITAGNLIAAGPSSPVLTQLVSLSPIYASFEADEQIVSGILAELPDGANARNFIDRVPIRMSVAGLPDVSGKLQLVDNSVDPQSGTIRVRAVFDNANGALIPGQFARLNMGQAKTETAVLINERAIGTDQNKKYVMVVKPDNTIEYREITVGARSEGLRVVTAGLKAEERIVVNGLQRIRPGALVAPEMVAMKPAAEQQASATN